MPNLAEHKDWKWKETANLAVFSVDDQHLKHF